MRTRPASSSRRGGLVLLVAAFFLALPGAVAAHSELKTADPADGAVLSADPAEVVLTFTETLNPAKSSVTLHDPAGTQIAKGAVDPTDDTVMRLTPPSLEPGIYEIRWTSAALDGDILRGTLHFTLTSPTPSPSAPPTASPSAPSSVSPSPSVAPSIVASPSPSAPTSPTGASGTDVLFPIIAALILVAVLGAWLMRNRSRGSGRA
jgi:methionine-rich copper-binding protein CopC